MKLCNKKLKLKKMDEANTLKKAKIWPKKKEKGKLCGIDGRLTHVNFFFFFKERIPWWLVVEREEARRVISAYL